MYIHLTSQVPTFQRCRQGLYKRSRTTVCYNRQNSEPIVASPIRLTTCAMVEKTLLPLHFLYRTLKALIDQSTYTSIFFHSNLNKI